MFSSVGLFHSPPSRAYEFHFTNSFRNSVIPFAGPYFPYPLSYTSLRAVFTSSGGLKSGSPTSRWIIFLPSSSRAFAFRNTERCVCFLSDCTFTDSLNRKLRNFNAVDWSKSISLDNLVTWFRNASSLSSSVTVMPRLALASPICLAMSVLVFNSLIISSVISSIFFRCSSISDILDNWFYETAL